MKPVPMELPGPLLLYVRYKKRESCYLVKEMNQRVLNYFMPYPESLFACYKSIFFIQQPDKPKTLDFIEIASYKWWMQGLEPKLTLTASDAFKAPFNEAF